MYHQATKSYSIVQYTRIERKFSNIHVWISLSLITLFANTTLTISASWVKRRFFPPAGGLLSTERADNTMSCAKMQNSGWYMKAKYSAYCFYTHSPVRSPECTDDSRHSEAAQIGFPSLLSILHTPPVVDYTINQCGSYFIQNIPSPSSSSVSTRTSSPFCSMMLCFSCTIMSPFVCHERQRNQARVRDNPKP